MNPAPWWIISCFFGLFSLISPTNRSMSDIQLSVMTYNIRYANPEDGRNAWQYRKEEVSHLIQFYGADLIGLQEVVYEQLMYLEDELTDYGRIGVGRDDGKQSGEFSPIFYAQEKLVLLDQGTFWLSETPERPSVGWDAAMERIATWGKFRHQASGDTLFFLNTHFDHRGENARRESARLIRHWIGQQARDKPIIITGDFNANPTSEPYRIMTGDGQLNDAMEVSQRSSVGRLGTFSGFAVTPKLPGERIDYIFASSDIQVLRHQIVSSHRTGYYPSDHLPVFAELRW